MNSTVVHRPQSPVPRLQSPVPSPQFLLTLHSLRTLLHILALENGSIDFSEFPAEIETQKLPVATLERVLYEDVGFAVRELNTGAQYVLHRQGEGHVFHFTKLLLQR